VIKMAKVWGPLHSDDARGKLAESMVFLGWRGLKTVRMWKKPANPKTEDQQTQRGVFSSAVADYHTLKPADQVAWKLRASGEKVSGFNAYVKEFIDAKIDVGAYNTISSVSITQSGGVCTVHCKFETSQTARLKAGSTRGTWTIEVSSATKNTAQHLKYDNYASETIYYYMIESLAASCPGETGHYQFETSA